MAPPKINYKSNKIENYGFQRDSKEPAKIPSRPRHNSLPNKLLGHFRTPSTASLVSINSVESGYYSDVGEPSPLETPCRCDTYVSEANGRGFGGFQENTEVSVGLEKSVQAVRGFDNWTDVQSRINDTLNASDSFAERIWLNRFFSEDFLTLDKIKEDPQSVLLSLIFYVHWLRDKFDDNQKTKIDEKIHQLQISAENLEDAEETTSIIKNLKVIRLEFQTFLVSCFSSEESKSNTGIYHTGAWNAFYGSINVIRNHKSLDKELHLADERKWHSWRVWGKRLTAGLSCTVINGLGIAAFSRSAYINLSTVAISSLTVGTGLSIILAVLGWTGHRFSTKEKLILGTVMASVYIQTTACLVNNLLSYFMPWPVAVMGFFIGFTVVAGSFLAGYWARGDLELKLYEKYGAREELQDVIKLNAEALGHQESILPWTHGREDFGELSKNLGNRQDERVINHAALQPQVEDIPEIDDKQVLSNEDEFFYILNLDEIMREPDEISDEASSMDKLIEKIKKQDKKKKLKPNIQIIESMAEELLVENIRLVSQEVRKRTLCISRKEENHSIHNKEFMNFMHEAIEEASGVKTRLNDLQKKENEIYRCFRKEVEVEGPQPLEFTENTSRPEVVLSIREGALINNHTLLNDFSEEEVEEYRAFVRLNNQIYSLCAEAQNALDFNKDNNQKDLTEFQINLEKMATNALKRDFKSIRNVIVRGLMQEEDCLLEKAKILLKQRSDQYLKLTLELVRDLLKSEEDLTQEAFDSRLRSKKNSNPILPSEYIQKQSKGLSWNLVFKEVVEQINYPEGHMYSFCQKVQELKSKFKDMEAKDKLLGCPNKSDVEVKEMVLKDPEVRRILGLEQLPS